MTKTTKIETQDEKAQRDLTVVIETLERKVRVADGALIKLVEGLQKDPAYTLSWSQDSFGHAAQRAVAEGVLQFIKSEQVKGKKPFDLLLQISNIASEKVVSGARFPKFSTSTVSNLMEQLTIAAWVDLQYLIEGFGL